MGVRKGGQNGNLSRTGNWDLEPTFLVKLVALFGLFDLIFAIIVDLPLILTLQTSQVWCKRVARNFDRGQTTPMSQHLNM